MPDLAILQKYILWRQVTPEKKEEMLDKLKILGVFAEKEELLTGAGNRAN